MDEPTEDTVEPGTGGSRRTFLKGLIAVGFTVPFVQTFGETSASSVTTTTLIPTTTTIPVTTIPVTTIPVTTIPVTTIPVTTIPVTTIPVTTVPVTTVAVTTTASVTTTPKATTTPAPTTTSLVPIPGGGGGGTSTTPPICVPTIPHTLRRGSRGTLVQSLQTLLTQKGFGPVDVDGVFGRLTKAAVKAFQAAHGLKADGVVGPATWLALLC